MKIFNNKFLILLMLLPFLRPAIYVIGPNVDSFLNYYGLIEFIILLIIYLKNKRISRLFLFFFLLELFPIISTFISGNYNNLINLFYTILSILSLCMIYELGFQTNKSKVLDVSFKYFGLLLFINSITFFVYYPNGMDQEIYMDVLGDKNFYFLGHDNGTIFYSIVVLFLGILSSIDKYGQISTFIKIYSIFIVFGYFYINSGNAKVVGLIILLYEFFYKFFEKRKGLNIKNVMIFYLIFYLLIVLFRSNLNVITYALNILGKDHTFSGRTIIWDKAFEYIRLKPILGFGIENSNILIYKFGYAKLHNMILQIIYNGGLLSLTALGFIYTIVCKSINKIKSIKYEKLEVIFILTFLLASTFDFYANRPIIYLLFILIFNTNNILRGSDKLEN